MKVIVKDGKGKPECPYSPYAPDKAPDSEFSQFDQWHRDNPSHVALVGDYLTELADGEYDAELYQQCCYGGSGWQFCNQGDCCLNEKRLVYLQIKTEEKPVFINRDKILELINNTLGDTNPKLAEMLVIQIKEL